MGRLTKIINFGGDPILRAIPLYTKKMSDNVVASVDQLFDLNDESWHRSRSQFLTLTLEDKKKGRYIRVRLKTFRKIVKWLDKLSFLEPRRLTDKEINVLNRKLAREKRHVRE